ncbi:uncharacterized protein LOC133799848 [Humulus lupulus]|uniref:uncharacterized protein LOC133799848 n=1 Tax=Humulus lupulus TaxID=3486 RepID=UPI002B4029AE|nr:uncharacterized protein LOC133799848 [Humulus lupulus]
MLKPDFVFLSETVSSQSQLEVLRVRLGFCGKIVVEKIGRSGGLCLLWGDFVDVELIEFSMFHIDVFIDAVGSPSWRFTGLYGQPDAILRKDFWRFLGMLASSYEGPWLCEGDLNEIIVASEKDVAASRPNYLMRNFKQALSDCDLIVLGFSGPKFTWCNRHKDSTFTQVRLDRMLGNPKWFDLFPSFSVSHLSFWGSDHRPLHVQINHTNEGIKGHMLLKSRFHYETAWEEDEECGNIISLAWNSGVGYNFETLATKIANVATNLGRWNTTVFKRHHKDIKKKQKQLKSLDASLSVANLKDYVSLEKELDVPHYKEEKYWAPRSKQNWLMLEFGQDNLAGVFQDYFQSIFESGSPTCVDMDLVLNAIVPKVTSRMNDQLTRRYTGEDVRKALFQKNPSKSPGKDGMSAGFYQKYWDTIGPEVSSVCLRFLNEGGHIKAGVVVRRQEKPKMRLQVEEQKLGFWGTGGGEESTDGYLPKISVNTTLITLIPKIDDPKHASDFRPISLCNVLYKIIAKSMTNRLREILGSVISDEQSAFLPGRLITDNSMIDFECVNHLKRRVKSKFGAFALKLDMSKAYDRVEWSFLCSLMRKLGIHEQWINLVLACISSVGYAFNLNGEILGKIIPSRGLRQGDPLSPFLFLICAEASVFACHRFKQLLNWYGKASGQLVNFSKSAMCFSSQISSSDAADMAAILGVPMVACHEKYLGLPCYAGQSKKGIFQSLKDRIWNKLFSWKSRSFSAAGKEVLIKSVIQSIPAYSMNLFKLPASFIKQMHRLCARFWWGGNVDKQKLHWCAWERLCWHKSDGGMGFRDLSLFNQGLLAKQVVRLYSIPDSLVAKVMKALYYPTSSVLTATSSKKSSFIWRSILWGKELFLSRARWLIKDGNNVSVYHDRWIPRLNGDRSCSNHFLPEDAMVSSLLLPDDNWNSVLISEAFNLQEATAILSIPRNHLPITDCVIWHFKSLGFYTVKSGYWQAIRLLGIGQASGSNGASVIWTKIWQLNIPGKVRQFLLRGANNWLPTFSNLCNRGISVDSLCLFCLKGPETALHALWNYDRLSNFRHTVGNIILVPPYTRMDIYEFLLNCLDSLSVTDFGKLISLAFLDRHLNANGGSFPASESLRDTPKVHRWEKPVEGGVKINCDAGLDHVAKKAGAGAVFRDFHGMVLASSTWSWDHLLDPTIVEALAVYHSILLCSRLGYLTVVIESDCAIVVRAINSHKIEHSYLGYIIRDILAYCNSFHSISFNFCPRMANSVAHSLAKFALSLSDDFVWWPGYPECINVVIQDDIT